MAIPLSNSRSHKIPSNNSLANKVPVNKVLKKIDGWKLSSAAIFSLCILAAVSSAVSAAEIEGKLYQVIQEGTKSSSMHFVLIRDGQSTLRLTDLGVGVKKALEKVPAGSNVKFIGEEAEGFFKPAEITSISAPRSASARTNEDIPEAVIPGTRKIAIVPITFTNKSSTPACDPQSALNHFKSTGAIAKHNLENSKGRIAYEASVHAPVAVPFGDCDVKAGEWRDEVVRVLATRGVNVDSFFAFMMLAPNVALGNNDPNTCDNSSATPGTGQLNPPEKLWVMMNQTHCGDPKTMAHELGHSLGWHHASSPTSEYGDWTDLMGAGGFSHSNPVHKIELGVIKPKHIQMITKSGAYRVHAMAKEADKIRVLRYKLPKIARHEPFDYTEMHIAYRTPETLDANWTRNQEDINKSYVYLWQGYHSALTLMYPPMNDAQTTEVKTRTSAGPNGEQPEILASIKQISHDANSSVICVQIPGLPAGDCSVEIAPHELKLQEVKITTPRPPKYYADSITISASMVPLAAPYTGSVGFYLDARSPVFINASPYNYCGPSIPGNPCESLTKGTHFLTVKPFPGPNGTGTPGESVTEIINIDDPILPVTIVSFEASVSVKNVLLKWKTADEVNFDRFEIEESTDDAKSWHLAGTVKASTPQSNRPRVSTDHSSRGRLRFRGPKASLSANGDYSYVVENPMAGKMLLYRLKLVDTDGTFSFSKIVNVKVETRR